VKVLLVTPMYYPHVGGVEYAVKSIAERLAQKGHEVTVLAGEPLVKRPHVEEINGVRVLRWPTWTLGGAYHLPLRVGELEKLLAELAEGADAVHVHHVHAVLPVWAGLKVRHPSRLVVTPHYHGTGHTPVRRAWWAVWRRYVKELLKRADVVHAASTYEADLLRSHYGVEPLVLEHGVDPDVLNHEWAPGDYAMYSGRLERYKNVHRLARVVKALAETGLHLKLRVYGDGPYKAKLSEELRKLGVDYSLEPFQPRPKYLEALAGARFFALLSEKEAFGLSVNEANAIGTPAVVAKPWGKSFEKRPRVLAVDLSESDGEIARRVARFLEDAPSQPKPRVQTWDEVAEKYLSMYR